MIARFIPQTTAVCATARAWNGQFASVIPAGSAPVPASRIAFWLRDGRVVAGMNVNVWDVNEHVQALIRSGQPVETAALTDLDTALESLVGELSV